MRSFLVWVSLLILLLAPTPPTVEEEGSLSLPGDLAAASAELAAVMAEEVTMGISA